MELDKTNEAHVVAVHEAAHALAVERTGATITNFWMKSHEAGWEGDVSHGGRAGLSDFDAAELDRMGYLAGPAAEERFAGRCDFDECARDLALAESISEQLPADRESLDVARARVGALLEDEATWAAVATLARKLLDRPERESVSHEEVEEVVVSLLGPPPAPGWTI